MTSPNVCTVVLKSQQNQETFEEDACMHEEKQNTRTTTASFFKYGNNETAVISNIKTDIP